MNSVFLRIPHAPLFTGILGVRILGARSKGLVHIGSKKKKKKEEIKKNTLTLSSAGPVGTTQMN